MGIVASTLRLGTALYVSVCLSKSRGLHAAKVGENDCER
jgi:hypothetical protein